MTKRGRFLTWQLTIATTLLSILSNGAYGGGSFDNGGDKTIHVVFRYDDYSNYTSIELETQIIQLFAKYDVPCTFAVIPYSGTVAFPEPGSEAMTTLSRQKRKLLKLAVRSGIIEVAQHGYSHQIINKRKGSEFRGLSYDTQIQKIADGKKTLEDNLGVKISAFCPPWNSYDKTTLRALEALGFGCISAASRRGEVVDNAQIRYIPATCEVLLLQRAVEQARKDNAKISIIVVMFHEFDFSEANPTGARFTIREFEKYLAWTASQDDVRISTLEAVSNAGGVGSKMFLENKRVHCVKSILPSCLWLSETLVSVDATAWGGLVKVWAVLIAYGAVIMLISVTLTVMGGRVLLSKIKRMRPLMKCCGPLVLILFCLAHVLGGWIDSRRFFLGLLVLIGLNIGILCLGLRYGRRERPSIRCR